MPRVEPERTEIILGRTPNGDVIAGIDGVSGRVEGMDTGNGQVLQRVLGASSARIAFVVDVDRSPRHGPGGPRPGVCLAVNIHSYERGPTWEPLSIGVGDRPLETVVRAGGLRKEQRPAARAISWITQRLLLPALPGSPAGTPGRFVASAGVDGNLVREAGFRIHGRGLVADVKAVGDRLEVIRVVRQVRGDQPGVMKLVHCDVTFTDVSAATVLEAAKRRQMAELAAGRGFLAMWNDYNRLESQYLSRTVRQIGFAQYHRVERLKDGTYRFTTANPHLGEGDIGSLAEYARQVTETGESLELEAAPRLPAVLTGASPDEPSAEEDWGLLDTEMPTDTVSGTVVRADPQAGTIDLRLTMLEVQTLGGIGIKRRVEPPDAGFLYRSFRGDRRQMLRRRTAWRRVLDRGTRIPHLLSLLEGERVEVPVLSRIKPRSVAALDRFHGGQPTQSQELALDIALNTPDIAIIQGPPGTGKTQVITALQARLAEEGRVFARVRGSMLLASYQHAAVDELVERSVVFGLPANKIDRTGRGTTVQTDQWRRDAIDSVTRTIGRSAHGRSLTALQAVAATHAGYLLAPKPAAGVARMLKDIEEQVGDLVPGQLADELRQRRGAFERTSTDGAAVLTDERELAIRAVRGLRISPESFGDDGPRVAAKVLRRVRALPDVGDQPDVAECLRVLAEAASWSAPEPPPTLPSFAAVRDTLLDRLTPTTGPAPEPVVDPGVADLLARVTNALEERVRETRGDGAELALLDYLEALKGDPEAVAWTLREYTASYAATCQQVSSPSMADAKQTRVDDVVFDTVIVDEAARANPLDLMIPLIHAGRRIVLVGDHNQLPHMLEPDVERMFQERDPAAPAQLKESLFERLFTRLGGRDAPIRRVVTLDTQFRMHPVLGDFVSRNFYGGGLRSGRPPEHFVHDLPGYGSAVVAWLSVPPERGREYSARSKYRPVEARRVAEEVSELVRAAPNLTFGVISFYAAQVQEIWKQLERLDLAKRTDEGYEVPDSLRYGADGQRVDRLRVGTVDAFQGKEFDVVLLSVTRCWPESEQPPDVTSPAHHRWVRRRYGHLILRNRLCVALSRQRRLLIAVGADEMFASGIAPTEVAPLVDLLRLAREEGGHGRFVSG
ncbi:AAA domain-containing protein [Micromonospora echinospora]|uniref:DEAD/DEAH box helicase n=1 Tax=Micromonospora echinospora TaxID=1877 RepID=UPI0033C506B4